jgi:hypothetical protein
VAGASAVIPGLGGRLVSHAYIEERLRDLDAATTARFERRITRWWRQVIRTLGPASSERAIRDVAITPLFELLDHRQPMTVPVITIPWTSPPSAGWREAARLGVAAGVPWAVIGNGRVLRILDCTRPWIPAGIEFDFERLTAGPKGIAALWMLANGPAMSGSGPTPLRALVIDSDRHAARVCQSVSDGVLASLPRLAGALAANSPARLQAASALDQALTIVYRILFLLSAEARALVPVWNEVYRQAYSIDVLADRAARSKSAGLWKALQAISRLAHAGCKAGDLDVTAFNGRLFSPRHTPLVEQRQVPDAIVRDVLVALATEPTRDGRRRVSYHDLGVEQLGSIYERVLEYEPSGRGQSLSITRTSQQRKTTGSFYTPRALTEFLVRRTLAPLVEGRSADDILNLRVVDPAMGSGAFLVAACRFLSAAHEEALIRDGQWVEADATPRQRAAVRRAVAERCLYGVDLNPTAVQLARLSLWLTTLAADRPLTFLDHHLATGNSLIGARLADLSRPPSTRPASARPALPLFDDLIAGEVAAEVLPVRLQLAREPSDSLESVRHKERSLAGLIGAGGPIAKWTAAADAWCAAGLWPDRPPSAGVVSEWIAFATGGVTSLPAAQLRASLERARAVAAAHGAFHWELAFPEAFFDAQGHPAADAGFDAVIGNPPWDMLRADTGSSAERADARSATAAALRFCRSARAYRHQGTGHPNCYQLFLERGLGLLKPGGRLGLLLPSGIATDRGSAALRRHLFDQTTIDTWLGFDNRLRIFPIHRSMRFLLLAATNRGSTTALRMRCGITDTDALERASSEALVISRSRLESWSPGDLAVPEITSPAALGILTSIADRVPALGDPSGWHARFGRELNATDDRPHFVPIDGPLPSGILPIIEGKQLSPFRVDTATRTGIAAKTAATLIDPAISFTRARIAYRDVASATNKLTLIAAMLPAGIITTHTVFCLKTPLEEQDQWCLLGLMNSLIANYLVRLRVTTHVTTAVMSRLPVPRPATGSLEFNELARLSRQLATTGIAEHSPEYAVLNTIAARLYGITPDEYAFILDSFPLIPQQQRALCLTDHVRATETRKHGMD